MIRTMLAMAALVLCVAGQHPIDATFTPPGSNRALIAPGATVSCQLNAVNCPWLTITYEVKLVQPNGIEWTMVDHHVLFVPWLETYTVPAGYPPGSTLYIAYEADCGMMTHRMSTYFFIQ
jgi:hypothetical protein